MTNELVARAVFLQRQGSLDEAEQLYRRVLRELPDHAGVLGGWAFELRPRTDRGGSRSLQTGGRQPSQFVTGAAQPRGSPSSSGSTRGGLRSITFGPGARSSSSCGRPGTVSACWRTIRGVCRFRSGLPRGHPASTAVRGRLHQSGRWRSGHSTGGPRLPWPSARLLCSSPTIPLPLRISVRT